MVVQSLTTLPAWPSSANRENLTPSQKSSLLSAVSNVLSNILSTAPILDSSRVPSSKSTKAVESLSKSTLTFLRSYLLDQAFQRLQTTIWGNEEPKSPVEKSIYSKVLKLCQALAEQGSLDDLKILTDLAIAYARSSPSKLRHIFSLCASNSPQVFFDVASALLPSFTTILQSTQGLYNQRKAAEVIYSFMVASSPSSKAGDTPDAPFLDPFIKHTSFFVALSDLYLSGLASTARSYGGTPALFSAISSSTEDMSEADPTEWTTIWVNTKLALIDSFHLLFKHLLTNLTHAKGPRQLAEQSEVAFGAIFAMMERAPPINDSGGDSSSTSSPPTPFLNLTLLQDYQRSHDLSQMLARALSKANERDARLDILESALVSVTASGNKEPGALTLLIRGSGLPRKNANDAKGKAPALPPAPATPGPPDDFTSQIDDVEIASKTSQILDLLPDLSSIYVGKLLKHPTYNGNVERVIEALLDGSALDAAALDAQSRPSAPRSTYSVVERRNVFDDEAVDFGSVRYGKRQDDAETLLAAPDRAMHEKMKADILKRVEIMDMESEEEEEDEDIFGDGKPTTKPKVVAFDDDDDIEEVVRVPGAGDQEDLDDTESDSEGPDDARWGETSPETIIEQAYVADPSVFARDSATRKSKARAELKQKTGWFDEQIEGWAIILERNPKKKDKISMKYEFRGNQVSLPGTSGTSTPRTDGETSQQSDGPGRGRGHGRGRGGRGRGGHRGGGGDGGGGGNGGHRGEPGGGRGGSSRGRALKDRNKASRANHDRKRGHDKKMAKMGGPS